MLWLCNQANTRKTKRNKLKAKSLGKSSIKDVKMVDFGNRQEKPHASQKLTFPGFYGDISKKNCNFAHDITTYTLFI